MHTHLVHAVERTHPRLKFADELIRRARECDQGKSTCRKGQGEYE